MRLGDVIHEALSRVGVTPAWVERQLGRPCGCEDRRMALNYWAERVLGGKLNRAVEYLERILDPKKKGEERGHTEDG